jgi:hypothetical protein
MRASHTTPGSICFNPSERAFRQGDGEIRLTMICASEKTMNLLILLCHKKHYMSRFAYPSKKSR